MVLACTTFSQVKSKSSAPTDTVTDLGDKQLLLKDIRQLILPYLTVPSLELLPVAILATKLLVFLRKHHCQYTLPPSHMVKENA